jgi:hypothetical protein
MLIQGYKRAMARRQTVQPGTYMREIEVAYRECKRRATVVCVCSFDAHGSAYVQEFGPDVLCLSISFNDKFRLLECGIGAQNVLVD